MRLLFDPVTMQYVVDQGTGSVITTSLEDLKNQQFPSEQTLRTEYYFSSDSRGHSHAPGNGCRYCRGYIEVGRASSGRHCPYSEF